jgi:hypothetical protein
MCCLFPAFLILLDEGGSTYVGKKCSVGSSALVFFVDFLPLLSLLGTLVYIYHIASANEISHHIAIWTSNSNNFMLERYRALITTRRPAILDALLITLVPLRPRRPLNRAGIPLKYILLVGSMQYS